MKTKGIAIIGNGFDLRHNLKTKYIDFMKYYIPIARNENVLINYFENMDRCNGWIDFEQYLLLFFEYVTKLKDSMSLTEYRNYYSIDEFDFITSPESKVFYHTLKEMNYPFWKSNTMNSILIELDNDEWHQDLVKSVLRDYGLLKKALKDYLYNEVNKRVNDINLLNTSEINVLRSVDEIYTFNYTNLLEAYKLKNINYVHGSLSNEIILGIPFSNEMRVKEFHHIFKIIQSISMRTNKTLVRSFSDHITLYFIGLSFGESDHYFFQEVKDWINSFYRGQGSVNKYLEFVFYVHSENAKLDTLYNLRLFLGEEMLTRYNLANKIEFRYYDDVPFKNAT